jgi:hypothetical protein
LNIVYLSPHFPPNYYQFCVHLRSLGATVLGLADEPYEQLRPELRDALTEYYWVPDMHNYDDLLRALGYFTHRYGKIDRLDSLNEYWLETEARLRTDFNIDGFRVADMPAVKRKSEMKKVYARAQVAVPRGYLIRDQEAARAFVADVGYPLVAKPDIGVGANKTYKIQNREQLEAFLATRPMADYILEEFIDATMQTFDGLTDHEGKIVFYTTHQYSHGIMETVNEDADIYYYSLRQIPIDLAEAGQRVVNAFGIHDRFFHFEFFRTGDNRLIALEVNMRPPGGLTTDMFNYANDINIYREWANIMVSNRFEAAYSWPYHVGYVGRKWNKSYVHSHEEILNCFGDLVVHHEEIMGIFSSALGNYGYLVRSPSLDQVVEIAKFIQEKQP